jgi:ABC-type bacteriocin/lantibiotic exporter with double-glycine peptidase domain
MTRVEKNIAPAETAPAAALNSQIAVLCRLMACVIRLRPDVLAAIVIGVISSGLELASLTSLFPLSQLASHQPIRDSSPWHRIPIALGFTPDAKFYAIAFLSLLMARTLTQAFAGLLISHINRNLISHFSARALEAYVRHLSFAEVQRQSIGHFMAVAGEEANRGASIISAIVKLIPLIILFLLYGIMLFYQSWRVGMGLVAFSVIILLCLFVIFRKSHQLGARQNRESRALNTHYLETKSGLRTVRSLTGEQFVTGRYDQMMRQYARTGFSIDTLNQVASILPTALLVTLLLIACDFATSDYLTAVLPAVMIGAVMVLRLLPLAAQTLDISQRLTADLKVGETILELLDAVKLSQTAETARLPPLKEPIRSVEFRGVLFRYGDEAPHILKNFNVTFSAGRSYALAGASGAGKSTIIDLLLKFYRPQAGSIRVNGRDIEEFSDQSLRQHVVLAEQAVRIFYDTIEHNVQFGRAAENRDVARVLDWVGLAPFLSSLPDGQGTLLNYQGSNVSGGQRQRIGLARALLRAGDVLILDESTNALDHATRERIVDRLLADYRDRILIFIAHDPFILDRVDEVIHLGDVSAPSPAAAVAG